MSKIRMGVIGCGGISNVHIQGILKSPDAILVALCDINENVLNEKGDLYNIPQEKRFTNYVDLINCPEVDAISICTPNESHYLITMEAIKHNKPFALEKPVTLTYIDAKVLSDEANKKKIPNMICFSYRFKTASRYAKHLIETGEIGELRHVYAQYLQSWGNNDVPLVWRFSKEKSGSGALGDLGSHAIDLVRFITGLDVKKVIGHGGTIIKERKGLETGLLQEVDVDDYCHYLAELEHGVSSTFEITRFGFGRGNYQRLEFYGTKGGLVYNLDQNGSGKDTLEICKEGQKYEEVILPEVYNGDQMQTFFNIINGVSDGLAAKIEDGAINQLVLDSIVQSIDEKKWIDINE